MASSGSFNTSAYSGNSGTRYLTFAWTEKSQNIAARTTTISWELKGGGTSNQEFFTRNIKLTINGETVYSFAGSSVSYKKLDLGTVVASGTYTFTHKTDGTQTFEAYAEAGIYVWAVNCTGSKTFTLDTIPRASTPTVSSSSVDMGGAVTINTNRESSSLTHDLAYSFAGGSYVTIKTGVGASYSWTTPDLASSIPNATSGTVTIRCITKSGSTTIGTKTVTMTLKVPTSVVPTISSVATAEATSGLAAQFGVYVKSKSQIKATITAAGAKGSTIKSYSTTFNGKTYTGSSWTSSAVTASGSLSLVTTVTDSRGRTAKKTTTITVLDYSCPAISALQVYRVNAEGDADQDGIYIAVHYKASATRLNNKNIFTGVIEYKRSTDPDTEWVKLSDIMLPAGNVSAYPLWVVEYVDKPKWVTFSTDYQYDVRLTVTDWFDEVTWTTPLQSGAVILDISADGKGIAFGKTSERAGVEIGWATFLSGGFMPIVLPDGTDLNTVTTPNTYAGRSISEAEYANTPITSGTFTLEVFPAGDAGQLGQRFTYCSKTAMAVYARFYYQSSWGSWVQQ